MKDKMRNRRRGPRQPVPDASDSIYYSADGEADMIYSSIHPSQRAYIDPWDLENYDYVRRQLSLSPGPSSTPSPAGEPISSAFLYLPTNSEECPACCAGLDEQTFYNAKYESIIDEDRAYSTYTDLESSSSNERHSSCDSAVSTLMLHTPGFGAISGGRRLVLPKPAPRLEFPAPPPYELTIPIPDNNYCSLSDCYDCAPDNVPLYVPSSLRGGVSPAYHTQRFGLSQKGLLQIDYSCNWNNLDRYIAKEL